VDESCKPHSRDVPAAGVDAVKVPDSLGGSREMVSQEATPAAIVREKSRAKVVNYESATAIECKITFVAVTAVVNPIHRVGE
jgi:hypothetical protein